MDQLLIRKFFTCYDGQMASYTYSQVIVLLLQLIGISFYKTGTHLVKFSKTIFFSAIQVPYNFMLKATFFTTVNTNSLKLIVSVFKLFIFTFLNSVKFCLEQKNAWSRFASILYKLKDTRRDRSWHLCRSVRTLRH